MWYALNAGDCSIARSISHGDEPSPNIVSSIASAVGLNRTATQKAVVAAVPALLAALINYVTKPQGASKLAEIVRKQGMLSSLASVIDVGELGTAAVNHLYSSLTGIKNEASAQANLPKS